MFVYVLFFFIAIVGGMLYGKKFVNKKVVQYALKAGCSQEQAERIFFLLQNGKKLEKEAKKEVEKAFKQSFVNDHWEKMKKGGTE